MYRVHQCLLRKGKFKLCQGGQTYQVIGFLGGKLMQIMHTDSIYSMLLCSDPAAFHQFRYFASERLR